MFVTNNRASSTILIYIAKPFNKIDADGNVEICGFLYDKDTGRQIRRLKKAKPAAPPASTVKAQSSPAEAQPEEAVHPTPDKDDWETKHRAMYPMYTLGTPAWIDSQIYFYWGAKVREDGHLAFEGQVLHRLRKPENEYVESARDPLELKMARKAIREFYYFPATSFIDEIDLPFVTNNYASSIIVRQMCKKAQLRRALYFFQQIPRSVNPCVDTAYLFARSSTPPCSNRPVSNRPS
ncbi:hypothetical protein HBI93_149370 [Parastagonospora nodorum]|nr:hypothetical protein HBI93_149370 [Parastagonospora nodorum]KAH5968955.1 hypothetical protein HBI86_050710 [Parastagonospora nodorum]